MDNITHSLFALTLARTRLSTLGRGTTAALVLASNAPDIDIVAATNGAVSYLKWHRGPTHGLLGIAGLGLATAALVWVARSVWDRRRTSTAERADASFRALAAVSMFAVAFHVLMDLPTSYGTRLLSPFDWHWYAVDWIPIIDVYLLTVLALGVALGFRSKAAGRRSAALVLAFMAANYGVRAAAHHQALVEAPQLFGPLLPPPCTTTIGETAAVSTWPLHGEGAVSNSHGEQYVRRDGTPGRCLVEIAAMPGLTSPFRWRVIARMSNAYELHDIDVLDSRLRDFSTNREAFWRLSVQYPNQWTSAVFAAAATHVGQVFLGFSRFPAARSVVDSGGNATVRLTDMRFAGGPVNLDQRAIRPNLFTAIVRIGPDGKTLLEQFGP